MQLKFYKHYLYICPCICIFLHVSPGIQSVQLFEMPVCFLLQTSWIPDYADNIYKSTIFSFETSQENIIYDSSHINDGKLNMNFTEQFSTKEKTHED